MIPPSPQLLHLSVSPRRDSSFSRRLGQTFVDALAADVAGLRVVERDLAAAPPPHPEAAFVAASLRPAAERSGAEREVLTLSETLISELEAADIVLVSSPMHNFTVPSALKAWLDHVIRPGRTFRATPFGKVGLLSDRPVFAIIACGGRFGVDPASQTDFFTPYLRYALGVIGFKDVEMLRVEDLGRTDERLERSLSAASGWIETQVRRLSAPT